RRLISYGPLIATNRRAAEYIDKVLKGTKPGDLPVEQSTKFELIIDVKAARTFDVTIPQSVVMLAYESLSNRQGTQKRAPECFSIVLLSMLSVLGRVRLGSGTVGKVNQQPLGGSHGQGVLGRNVSLDQESGRIGCIRKNCRAGDPSFRRAFSCA